MLIAAGRGKGPAQRHAGAMDGWAIKQYAAQEQAELRVRILIPGSWFNGLAVAPSRPGEQARSQDYAQFMLSAARNQRLK